MNMDLNEELGTSFSLIWNSNVVFSNHLTM